MGPIILSDNLHKSQECCTFAPANEKQNEDDQQKQ